MSEYERAIARLTAARQKLRQAAYKLKHWEISLLEYRDAVKVLELALRDLEAVLAGEI